MKRDNWFFTPIWIDYLQIDCTQIAEKCLKLKNNNYPNRVYTNHGGWQSQDLDTITLNQFTELCHAITTRCNIIAKEIQHDLRLELDNIWININDRGNHNEKHVHASSAFSGVIYIQTDEKTGNIRFHDDQFLLKHYPLQLSVNNNYFHHAVFYKPVNGMMMIFPSWTSHDVLPSESDLTRISISFNIKQS